MNRVVVGCCGFPMSRSRYYGLFEAVELQETFYNPLNPESLKRCRREAPEGFKFAMKGWQAITHPPESPTWRRSKFRPPGGCGDRYGHLRPTKEVMEAWELVREAAEALGATYVVLQLPPSFTYSRENLTNVKDFLSATCDATFRIGIELRGDWHGHDEELRSVLEGFSNVVHVTDPFRWFPPAKQSGNCYFRLHGIGGREVNYRYKYSAEDLVKLKEMLEGLKPPSEVYVMFNNVHMREDALNFMKLIHRHHNPSSQLSNSRV
ncbi:MAG: DUF72 domain-containing protein [Zestosphaera sp.]